jgi:hypothetical protein
MLNTDSDMKKTIIALIVIPFVIHSLSFTGPDITLSKLWESDSILMTPESVVFDSLRNCLYVSNFNDKGGFREKTDTIFDECISKVDLEGNIIELRWIDNLIGPTGIAIYKDTLYVVERGYLTKIDIVKKAVIDRLKIEDTGFLNDIAIDRNGEIYISDSRDKKIFKIKDNQYEIWLSDSILEMANGLYIDNNKLIIGNQSNANLFYVSIPDKIIKVIASNISKGIDGIKKYRQNYIVSWRYNMFMVNEQGISQIILNTQEGNNWNADFELIKSENIVVVPTLLSNRIIAYKINYE